MRDFALEDQASLIAPRPKAAPRRRRSALVAAAFGAFVVAGLAVGVRYGAPVQAALHPLTAAAFDVAVKGPGLLEARRHASLGATVQGRIAALPVDVGDHVTAGTPVARLEAAEAEIDLAQAVEQARALAHQIAESEAQRRREAAGYRRLDRELARQEELRARGVIADGALDIARAERDGAEAGVAEAAARIERLKADLAGAERLVDRRREALAQTVVAAPFDGVVVARAREVGDVATPGATILEIVDAETLILSARIDESQIAAIAAGQTASVRFESEPGRSHAASVHRIGREVDPETRELVVELSLRSLPRNWAIGQRGAATITVARKAGALALPTDMVAHRDGAAGVWVLQDGRARWRSIEIGAASGDSVAVVAGLAEGDVALDGPKLYRGARVEARP